MLTVNRGQRLFREVIIKRSPAVYVFGISYICAKTGMILGIVRHSRGIVERRWWWCIASKTGLFMGLCPWDRRLSNQWPTVPRNSFTIYLSSLLLRWSKGACKSSKYRWGSIDEGSEKLDIAKQAHPGSRTEGTGTRYVTITPESTMKLLKWSVVMVNQSGYTKPHWIIIGTPTTSGRNEIWRHDFAETLSIGSIQRYFSPAAFAINFFLHNYLIEK